MKNKSVLNFITILAFICSLIVFRKGSIKDWLLVYLFKGVIASLIDTAVAKKKLVQYPTRYFPGSFYPNIIFDYVFFPMICVLYSQLTNNAKVMKTILSVFLLSVPMTIMESLLVKNTDLIKYSNKWSWLHTLAYLTGTFWSSRLFIAGVRFLEQKRNKKEGANPSFSVSSNLKDYEETQTILRSIQY